MQRYGLGTPKFFGVDASKQSFNHPDGQPKADRSNQAAQIAQQRTQEAAPSPATVAEEIAEEGGAVCVFILVNTGRLQMVNETLSRQHFGRLHY